MPKLGHIDAKRAGGLAPGRRLSLLLAASSAALVVLFMPAPPEGADGQWGRVAEAVSCPKGMVSINDKFCIDQYEARTVEIDKPRKGKHKPEIVKGHSPFKRVTGLNVMAVSERGKVPQGHISQEEAADACFNAGKRLCSDDEWLEACQGKKPTLYPYGDEREEGRCNDKGVSGFNLLFGPGNNTPPEQSAYTVENMNDPRLNQVEGSLATSGFFSKCKNGFKVYDMVGNLHEWTSNKQGTFRGGYYLDTSINGEGCEYRTTAHDVKYRDYSTGFRCCSGGPEQQKADKLRKEQELAEKEKKAAEKEKKAAEKEKKLALEKKEKAAEKEKKATEKKKLEKQKLAGSDKKKKDKDKGKDKKASKKKASSEATASAL